MLLPSNEVFLRPDEERASKQNGTIIPVLFLLRIQNQPAILKHKRIVPTRDSHCYEGLGKIKVSTTTLKHFRTTHIRFESYHRDLRSKRLKYFQIPRY